MQAVDYSDAVMFQARREHHIFNLRHWLFHLCYALLRRGGIGVCYSNGCEDGVIDVVVETMMHEVVVVAAVMQKGRQCSIHLGFHDNRGIILFFSSKIIEECV